MNNNDTIKKIMELGINFHMCDVSEVSENGIHLESWNQDVSCNEFTQIAALITEDGYDIEGFELLEIPHPQVFCFGNLTTDQFFDVVKFFDDKWQFSYIKDSSNELATSIEDAVSKYEVYRCD